MCRPDQPKPSRAVRVLNNRAQQGRAVRGMLGFRVGRGTAHIGPLPASTKLPKVSWLESSMIRSVF